MNYKNFKKILKKVAFLVDKNFKVNILSIQSKKTNNKKFGVQFFNCRVELKLQLTYRREGRLTPRRSQNIFNIKIYIFL